MKETHCDATNCKDTHATHIRTVRIAGMVFRIVLCLTHADKYDAKRKA